MIGIGSKRNYIDLHALSLNTTYPPRPVPNSIADLDIVMDHCDFSQRKVCKLSFFAIVDLFNIL
jgi:WD repeat and SOF domain-containing protein 1